MGSVAGFLSAFLLVVSLSGSVLPAPTVEVGDQCTEWMVQEYLLRAGLKHNDRQIAYLSSTLTTACKLTAIQAVLNNSVNENDTVLKEKLDEHLVNLCHFMNNNTSAWVGVENPPTLDCSTDAGSSPSSSTLPLFCVTRVNSAVFSTYSQELVEEWAGGHDRIAAVDDRTPNCRDKIEQRAASN